MAHKKRSPLHRPPPLTPEAFQTRDPLLRVARPAVVHRLAGALDRDRIILRSLLHDPISDLRQAEDRRQLHRHYQQRQYLRIDGTPARPRMLPLQSGLRGLRSQMRFQFPVPKETLVCVRRQVRRRIIFAMQKAGRGGQKKPSWTETSRVVCRRR